MNFKDIGIIIAKKPLKENSFILTVFTENHGLYSGFTKESAKKTKAIYQEGNIIDFFWQARLHEHIGLARGELIKAYSGLLLSNKAKLYAFNSIISLIKLAFQERESHPNFFTFLVKYLGELTENFCFRNYINFELAMLAEAGYELVLDKCAVTKVANNLSYVSPKSGRALSEEIGSPYKDKLLILPEFLTLDARNITKEITLAEKKQALTLTTYFFNRYFFYNNQQPYARQAFIDYVLGSI
ncbi:MAG: DNA repair protein RecO [Rickettsia endosymbiont of Oxypoda opaca]|nr:DNA repair protein RecO [Rickettsia endosymbiont of Oxypoda opaca]